jgi:TctA family transporter
MGILEGLVSGFLQAISLAVFPYLLIGATFGLVIGVIPGLSGHFAMAMVIPFLYSMEPGAGVAFLLGAHSTVAQGGGLTAILFSTPGTGQNAATLLDGVPMRRNGEGAMAAGAALTACFLGATFGAVRSQPDRCLAGPAAGDGRARQRDEPGAVHLRPARTP